MTKQIFIGLAVEGPTDKRFLENIVYRTFEEVAFRECDCDIEIYVQNLNVSKTDLSFSQFVEKTSFEGVKKFGIMTLAIHTDADKETYDERFKNKIVPAYELLSAKDDMSYCKILTPIIPVRMIEAWMLADKQLFKEEIGTNKSDNELGINKNPEQIANPKKCIEEAIRIATKDLPSRRMKIRISDLYGILGQKISIEALRGLDSYNKFEEAVIQTYKDLKLIYA